MVRSDFPFEARHAWQRAVRFALGEAFLGFLAIVMVALTLVPVFFKITAIGDSWLEGAQLGIVAIFGAEYLLGLTWAEDRKAFLLNPWRFLDLLTIVIPLITLLPNVSNLLRSSMALRLLRLVRILTLGLRASGVIVRDEVRKITAAPVGPVQVSVLRENEGKAPRSATWAEFLQWAKSPGKAWYNVSNVGPEQMREMATAVGIPPASVESHLLTATYPHLEAADRYVSLFAWFPEFQSGTAVERNGLLLLATDRGVFTLSQRQTDLLKEMAATAPRTKLGALPFPARLTWTFLRAILNRNEQLVGRFERELRGLEELPVRESRPQFFEQTFRLKKELSAAQSDLWRLKGILVALAEGRVRLPESGAEPNDFYQALVEDADYLYETVVNTREGLLSLIDLHLNVVSFEMNRVMRVLAVVSVLGLIPAVVGGLFGMNLADNPWPYTLPQVAFAVCLAMVVSLYLFFVKGWLR